MENQGRLRYCNRKWLNSDEAKLLASQIKRRRLASSTSTPTPQLLALAIMMLRIGGLGLLR